MTKLSLFKVLAAALIGCRLIGTVHAQDASQKSVKVAVHGYVVLSGRYSLQTPATIEQALDKAGGWNGKGGLGPDDGVPAKVCAIHQHRGHRLITTKFAVSVDRQTRQITILDERWKSYHLAEGDGIEMPGVFF